MLLGDSYWLYEWLDSRQLTNIIDVRTALGNVGTLRTLRDEAESWHSTKSTQPGELNLVAGTGMRLNDYLSCPQPICRKRQIDSLFRHAWHYFDHIYLPDSVGSLLRTQSNAKVEDYLEELSNRIEVTLYLRSIGAESLIRYYPTSGEQRDSDQEVTAQAEVSGRHEAWEELAAEFLSKTDHYRIKDLGKNNYQVMYKDGELDFNPHLTVALTRKEKAGRRQKLRAILTETMITQHRATLEVDIYNANYLGGSLGSTIWTHQRVLSRSVRSPDHNAPFFQMNFPSLVNVSIEDLIALRAGERESFLAFRAALRKAVQDISIEANKGSEDIAAIIVRDIINPEVARLEHKLNAARKVLATKSAIALAVAGVSTWCGLHVGAALPLSLGAGSLAGFASGFNTAASKYAEEKRDLEVSDMFFLWKALRCAPK